MLFVAGQTAVGLETYRGHGLAMHGDLKYKAGFSHFDYVNPDAPKGGETVRAAIGGYDTFNPFVIKGRAAAGSGSGLRSARWRASLASGLAPGPKGPAPVMLLAALAKLSAVATATEGVVVPGGAGGWWMWSPK